MVSMLYEGEERKQAYGVIAASAALATIIPIALGILVDIAGFRVTFGVLAAYFVCTARCERQPADGWRAARGQV